MKMTNKAYENARNALIPKAVKAADMAMGRKPAGAVKAREIWCDKWNQIYHATMDQLAKERGLT